MPSKGLFQRLLVAGVACGALALPTGATAATINVNTASDENGAGASCGLREAVTAANTDGDFGGCIVANEGSDTIVLTAGATYGRTVMSPIVIQDENATITGNGATIQGTDTLAGGSVLEVSDATATITGVTVRDGVSDYGGGIEVVDGPGGATALNLFSSTVTSNSAGEGGGIKLFFGDLELTNVTISGNSASYGAGMDLESNGTEMRNITVTGNNAGTSGGGMWVSDPATHTMLNSIIAGNTAPQGPDCYEGVGTTLVSAGHVLIGDPSDCTYTPGSGDRTGAAGLGPLANNGGLTPTHGLLSGSQAIDAGHQGTPDGSGFHCEPTDQRGVARPVGTYCDMGAFEGTLTIAVSNPPQLVDPFDLRAALRRCKKRFDKGTKGRKRCFAKARRKDAAAG